MKRINIYKLLCIGLVAAFIGIGFQADGQIGNLKKLKEKAEKKTKETKKDEPEVSKSGTTKSGVEVSGEYDGPAKYAINSFNRSCDRMQKFLDEGTWGGGQTGQLSYDTYLEMAGEELGKMKTKDPKLNTAAYQEKYDGYKVKWDERVAEMERKKKEEEEAKLAAGKGGLGIVKDDGITSEFHRKYLKKIVFSSEKINLKDPDESKVKTSFKIGEPIFRRVYCEKSLGNYYRGYNESGKQPKNYWRFNNTDGEITWKWYVDGKVAFEEVQRLREIQVGADRIDEWTTWWTEIVPVKDDRYNEVKAPVSQVGELLAFMEPGTHKIKVEAWVTDPVIPNKGGLGLMEIMAEGEFTITLTTAEQTDYRRKRGVLMPQAWKSDPTLEKQMLSTFKSTFPDATPLRVVITQGSWTVNRKKATDVILNRTRDATVAYKNKDGTCTMLKVIYKQIHEGSGYGKLQVSVDIFDGGWRIGCEDVNIKQ